MAMIKGIDIVSIKKIFREQGQGLEQIFLSKLPPEILRLYTTIIATTWVPLEKQLIIYNKSAETLFPDRLDKYFILGYHLASKSFSGVYKVFFRIPSINFIMKRVAAIWRSYFDVGIASIENNTPNSLDMVVSNFPDYPAISLELTRGFLTYVLELTGASNIQIKVITNNPQAWRWMASWD